jgi:transketolase
MRQQFPSSILDIMAEDDRVVVLLGDIGVHAFREVFEKYPKRIWNIGICEQSMVGMAAGLAMAGFIPVIHTISPFLVARAYEQIRDDFGFQNLVGTFVGVNVYDTSPNLGLTHSCPEDLDMMQGIPNMNVICPQNPEMFDAILRQNYADKLNYFRIK